MKTIDRLLISSFIPPFIVTFFIALFVLIMQFLWTYIDDIVGKGASIFMIIELLFYLSMSLVPTALPIAILISSVMVMGNLAERYELASIKSAGVPLLRVMQPLMFVAALVSVFSFVCSNNLIPLSNLKFKSRLYDIRKQKPTLSLEEGVFNDDFRNLVIRIGEKETDNRTIRDILIYDHNNYNRGKAVMILAERGEMYITQDKRYFIMELFNGTQYQETQPSGTGDDRSYPFVRTSFDNWTKVLDLGEFAINRTDEELFKSHQTMLSTAQLRVAIDSIDLKIDNRLQELARHVNYYLTPYKQKDSLVRTEVGSPEELAKTQGDTTLIQVNKSPTKPASASNIIQQQESRVAKLIVSDLDSYLAFGDSLTSSEQIRLMNKSKSFVRSILGQAESAERNLNRVRESRVKHIFELNLKFSMAFACFIFLFIGAPMGAIVRKGGFGYPILIAIIFFMLYIVLNIFCKKLAESFVIPATLAAWVPCLVLFPIGITLTYRAMRDSKIINVDRYMGWLYKIFKMSTS